MPRSDRPYKGAVPFEKQSGEHAGFALLDVEADGKEQPILIIPQTTDARAWLFDAIVDELEGVENKFDLADSIIERIGITASGPFHKLMARINEGEKVA